MTSSQNFHTSLDPVCLVSAGSLVFFGGGVGGRRDLRDTYVFPSDALGPVLRMFV